MLIKLNPVLHTFVRQKVETEHKPLTKQQWIKADRIVMVILLISVIIGAILFS